MNKLLLYTTLAINTALHAQISVSDTVTLMPQYKEAVYYSLSNGNKTGINNTNWHLAFSVQKVQFPNNTLPSVTIRHNGANGVVVFLKALNDTAFFTADTTGFSSFMKLYDSDSNLDTGAFNYGLNISQFDYGWGVYNPTTKNIPGRNVFFIQIGSGIKKFRVVELTYDTLWQIQYANLDNSNLQNITIPKRLYPGKLFAYLNLESNSVLNREPNTNDWDLLFHKYSARDVAGYDAYPSVGVWSNKGIEVAEAKHVDVSSNDYSSFSFSKKMNEIGRDWKDFTNGSWVLEDSLAYFVKDRSGKVYKIVFTGFEGSSTGRILFTKTTLLSSGIENTYSTNMLCYPNPASGWVTIVLDQAVAGSRWWLTDVSGKTVLVQNIERNGFLAFDVNVSRLSNGFYIATLEHNGSKIQQRIVVNK
jgi:hypothetical protein